MSKLKVNSVEIAHLNELFLIMKAATKDFRQDLLQLIRYAQSRIETEDELLERAAVMDELMDMAESEDDIAMLFTTAISDRIEEFESQQFVMP
ncbi:MAG: hypothetical protein HQK66_06590 [Desulfamplus sp.]|nr:hypothetical protein [Desulfamplus sp.]